MSFPTIEAAIKECPDAEKVIVTQDNKVRTEPPFEHHEVTVEQPAHLPLLPALREELFKKYPKELELVNNALAHFEQHHLENTHWSAQDIRQVFNSLEKATKEDIDDPFGTWSDTELSAEDINEALKDTTALEHFILSSLHSKEGDTLVTATLGATTAGITATTVGHAVPSVISNLSALLTSVANTVAAHSAATPLVAASMTSPHLTANTVSLLAASTTPVATSVATSALSNAAITTSAASLSTILASGASVAIPVGALFLAAHEAEELRHTISRNATSIASSALATEIALHPSVGDFITSGITGMINHPMVAVSGLVVGGLVALDHNVPYSSSGSRTATVYLDGQPHVEGTALRRGFRVVGNAAAGYLLATNPESIALLAGKTVHIIGKGLSAVIASTTPPAATTTALATTTTAATTTASHTLATATATSLVPHSAVTTTAIASHLGPILAPLTTAIAAHPIPLTVALGVGALALATNWSSSTPASEGANAYHES